MLDSKAWGRNSLHSLIFTRQITRPLSVQTNSRQGLIPLVTSRIKDRVQSEKAYYEPTDSSYPFQAFLVPVPRLYLLVQDSR